MARVLSVTWKTMHYRRKSGLYVPWSIPFRLAWTRIYHWWRPPVVKVYWTSNLVCSHGNVAGRLWETSHQEYHQR